MSFFLLSSDGIWRETASISLLPTAIDILSAFLLLLAYFFRQTWHYIILSSYTYVVPIVDLIFSK